MIVLSDMKEDTAKVVSCIESFNLIKIINNSVNILDIDECISDNCHQNARCTNTLGSYQCHCLDGFIGDGLTCRSTGRLNKEITTAKNFHVFSVGACSQPCQNNGVCNASGLCLCPQGFSGNFCEIGKG